MEQQTRRSIDQVRCGATLQKYSPEALVELLARQTTTLSNGAVGSLLCINTCLKFVIFFGAIRCIDFRFSEAPNLAKSEVLKMIDNESMPPHGTPRSSRQRSRLSSRSEHRWPPTRSTSREGPRDLSRDREIPKIPRPNSTERPGGRDLSREKGVGNLGGVPIVWPPAETIIPVGAAVVNMGALHDSQAYTQARKVAWPPKSPHASFDHGEEIVRRSMSPIQSGKVPPPVPPKPGRALDMSTIDSHTNDQGSTSESPIPPQLVSHPLRDEAPLHQSPSPVVASHPIAKTVNPSRKSGDQVWPPVRDEITSRNPEVSRSPLMRPKKVAKDYNGFFSQNVIPKTFPSYRAPPGTQHFATNGITQQ